MFTVALLVTIFVATVFRNAYRDYRRGSLRWGSIVIDGAETPGTFHAMLRRRLFVGITLLATAWGAVYASEHLTVQIPSNVKLAFASVVMGGIAIPGLGLIHRELQSGKATFRAGFGETVRNFYRGESPAGYWAVVAFHAFAFALCGALSVAGFLLTAQWAR